jgi:Tfp pilus assembly protein PilF
VALPDPHHPKVFVSYSHDSLEHSDRVRELSDRLRADGIDCILDQYEISPPEGWPRWTDREIRVAEFVLMICTETYYRRVMGEETPGIGLGVRWEGNSIYQHLYNAGTVNPKFIPVLLEPGNVEYIPTPLQGVARYAVQTEEGYEDLYRRLTNQPKHLKPELGEVRKLTPLAPKERKQDFFAASLTNLPFERNPFFTGREKILKDLHEAFGKKSAGSMTQAISGLGGLGKTQTAIEYAYRHRDDYKEVFWSRADSELALSIGFVEIARLLDLPEKDAQNPDDAVRAVIRWLENNSGWLLIFDNADVPELLKGFRPRNEDGHVLLTSRAQVFDVLGIAKPFEIDVMLPEEALTFLFTRTGRDDDNAVEKEAANQLTEELGYLPLALEQAGAFITAKQARFQDYLAGYRKRRLELLKESRPLAGDYPESVATTWSINFREVEEASEAASDLLRMSAFLSSDSIPLELITKGKSQIGPALSAALVDVDDDPLALNEVLQPLTRYSFIRLDSDSQTYSIHRLVQEVLRDGMDADTQKLWAERIVRALNQAFPSVEFKNWPSCERILPHAKTAAKLLERWNLAFEEAARLLNQLATYCYHRGQYADAEPLFRRSLQIYERALGPDDLNVATSLNNLAELCRRQGEYGEAEPLYKRSLRLRETTLGPDHPTVATSLSNLAALYFEEEDFAKAEPLFERSLAIRERSLGSDHPDVATSLNNLAALYRAQGKYVEAEPLQKRSLAMLEKTLGPNHPTVAKSLANLSALYFRKGEYTESESLLQRSLAITEELLGPDHPDVGVMLNNLAGLYVAQGKDLEAESLYRRSLEIKEKALGQEHPSVATSLENFAYLLLATQRDAEAARHAKRAAAIRAKYAKEDSEK